MDQHLSQIPAASLGDAEKLGLSAGRHLARDKAQPCREIPAFRERGRVADRGVQVFGGMGYMRETSVERFYRHARLFRIYEGTSEIQKLIVARNLVRGFES